MTYNKIFENELFYPKQKNRKKSPNCNSLADSLHCRAFRLLPKRVIHINADKNHRPAKDLSRDGSYPESEQYIRSKRLKFGSDETPQTKEHAATHDPAEDNQTAAEPGSDKKWTR